MKKNRVYLSSHLLSVLIYGQICMSVYGRPNDGTTLVSRLPDRTAAKYSKYSIPTSEILDVEPKELKVREGHQNMGSVTVTLLEKISLPLNVTVKGGYKPTIKAAMFPDLAVFPASWIFEPDGPMEQTVRIMVDEDDHSLALHKARLTWEAHTVGMEGNDPYFDDVSMLIMDYHIAGGSSLSAHKSKISLSWTFVLSVLFIPMLYLVGGFVYNVRVQHFAGIDAIPHLVFWLYFFGLVKDGVMFSLVTLKLVREEGDEDDDHDIPIRSEPDKSKYDAVP